MAGSWRFTRCEEDVDSTVTARRQRLDHMPGLRDLNARCDVIYRSIKANDITLLPASTVERQNARRRCLRTSSSIKSETAE